MKYKKIALICLMATCSNHSKILAYGPSMQACINSWNKETSTTVDKTQVITAVPASAQNNIQTSNSAQSRSITSSSNNKPEIFISNQLTESIEPLVVNMLFDGQKSPQHYAREIVTILEKAQKEKISNHAREHIAHAINLLGNCAQSTIASLIATGGKDWKALNGDVKMKRLLSRPLLNRLEKEPIESKLTLRLLTA